MEQRAQHNERRASRHTSTANFDGKLRRRGKFAGYRQEWKKAYVKLKAGQKVPDFAEV